MNLLFYLKNFGKNEATLSLTLAAIDSSPGIGRKILVTEDLNFDRSLFQNFEVQTVKDEPSFIELLEDLIRANKTEEILIIEDHVHISESTIAKLQKALQSSPLTHFVRPNSNLDRFFPFSSSASDFENHVNKLEDLNLTKNILYYFDYQGCCLISRNALPFFQGFSFKEAGLQSAFEDWFSYTNTKGFVALCATSSFSYIHGSSHHKQLDPGQFHSKHPSFNTKYVKFDHRSKFSELSFHLSCSQRKTLPSVAFDLTIFSEDQKFNGTLEATRKILNGIRQAISLSDTKLDLSFIASSAGAAMHGLQEWLPEFTHYLPTEARPFQFDLIIRLSQPCGLIDIHESHKYGKKNIFVVQDIISYDCLHYDSYTELDVVFKYLKNYIDHIIFISSFSQKVFESRFGKTHQSTVITHSLSLKDYSKVANNSNPLPSLLKDLKYLFIVGNDLAHKNVNECLNGLIGKTVFKLVSLGGNVQDESVITYKSGNLDDDFLNALYLQSQYIIFPSNYEGFGLPVLNALACGKIIFIRRGTVGEEIKSLLHNTPDIVLFKDHDELVELINKRPIPSRNKIEHPFSWQEVGRKYLNVIEQVLSSESQEVGLKRIEFWENNRTS